SILVPLPGAIDQDQKVNAEYLAKAGGAWMYEERSLGPRQLADRMTKLFDNSDTLVAAAKAAAGAGVSDGAQRLADLIELVARKSETTSSTSVEPNGKEADA
ncbi:MAG: glycosyltransferase, partial [Alphaproteobacteria bacterium]